ncbi:MAG: helix-turn-helix domain-containing protein [Erysipelotrichaceae bacterium]|nr:helix-turn-helix domain-containing protein [Erysipelotrichaceae bacterium]
MIKEQDLATILARNLVYYRKSAGFTQLDIAEKFNYSDKAISKWERGENAPDIFVLKALADFYGVPLTDFFSEKKKTYHPAGWKKHIIITLLAVVMVWFVAAIVFVAGELFNITDKMWLTWIFATVPSAIVLTVFSAIWGNRILTIVGASLIAWFTVLSVYVPLEVFAHTPNSYMIFLIAVPFQILIVLWYFLKIPDFIKRKLKIKPKEKDAE